MNFNGYEAAAITIVSKVSPWLTPIPTAWLVYDRTMLHLHWPQWVAICAGVTLELLGVAILSTALALYAYNRKKLKSHPVAPLWLAVILVAVYLVTALLLVMVLDIAPGIAVYSQALFPVLSLAAFVLLGLRLDHQERVTTIATGKAEAKERRSELKAERAERKAEQLEQRSEQLSYHWKCPRNDCDFVATSRHQRAGHGNAHRTKGASRGTEV